MLSERATMLAVICQNVLRAQQRMKKEDLQSRRPRLLAPPTVRVVLPGAGLAPEARLQVLRPLQDTGEDRYGRLRQPAEPRHRPPGKDFQTGQAHRASTGTMLIWPGTKTARPASPVPVPSTARPRARAWAAMPARWHGTGTARSRGRHGVGTAWSRWMETPAIPSRWM